MSYIIERRIPKHNSRGTIAPESTNRIELVKYQPKYGKFFIPETLGLRIGGYVDFYDITDTETGIKFFCFISDGCSISGRRISKNKNSKLQKKMRDTGTAQLSISLAEFNTWHLNLLPPSKISKTQSYQRIIEATKCTFTEQDIEGATTNIRTGIMMNLSTIRNGSSNIFQELGEIVPEWKSTIKH